MRIANLAGRLVALTSEGAVDVATATGNRFGADPAGTDPLRPFDHWAELLDAVAAGSAAPQPYDPGALLAPVPLPRQVFAIGLNYRDHAAEAGADLPASPPVFTKFPTSLTGPAATVELSSASVDYEVELVVVIGRRADGVAEDRAVDHVAGYMVGQDLSDRPEQLAGPMAQFSMGKSHLGYGPVGPAIVTLDEIADPDALDLGCAVGDEILQSGSTKDMIFGVPELIARLSRVCPLLPGDLIFTGTPAGVGAARTPARYLQAGETLRTWVHGVGEIRTILAATRSAE